MRNPTSYFIQNRITYIQVLAKRSTVINLGLAHVKLLNRAKIDDQVQDERKCVAGECKDLIKVLKAPPDEWAIVLVQSWVIQSSSIYKASHQLVFTSITIVLQCFEKLRAKDFANNKKINQNLTLIQIKVDLNYILILILSPILHSKVLIVNIGILNNEAHEIEICQLILKQNLSLDVTELLQTCHPFSINIALGPKLHANITSSSML